MLPTLITSKLSLLPTLKLSAGRPMTPKETCLLRRSSLTTAKLFRSQISIESQQPSSDQRLLDFSQGDRVQVHVDDGLLNQLTSDGEPLLAGCGWELLSEAIKD